MSSRLFVDITATDVKVRKVFIYVYIYVYIIEAVYLCSFRCHMDEMNTPYNTQVTVFFLNNYLYTHQIYWIFKSLDNTMISDCKRDRDESYFC